MSEKLQIRIGSDAEDRLDAERLQETVVYHWHRIALTVALLCVVLAGVGIAAYRWIHGGHSGSAVVSGVSGERMPIQTLDSAGPVAEPPQPAASVPRVEPPAQATKPSASPQASTRNDDSLSHPAGPEGQEPASADASASSRLKSAPEGKKALPAPVLTAQVPRLQLTSGLKGKLPVDDLGRDVNLEGRSIIRVYLYSRLKDLKGQLIYHEWFDGDRRVARIPIRPYLQAMNASTGKYLTQAMTGLWTVRVVDRQGRTLAERHFRVVGR